MRIKSYHIARNQVFLLPARPKKSNKITISMYRFHSIRLSSNKASKTSIEDNHIFRPIIYYLSGNNIFKSWFASSSLWLSLFLNCPQKHLKITPNSLVHCRMRNKSSMFLTAMFKNLIFLCRFNAELNGTIRNFMIPLARWATIGQKYNGVTET